MPDSGLLQHDRFRAKSRASKVQANGLELWEAKDLPAA
jgi:hypothetical protein